MAILDAAYWAACTVLVVSGLSKLPGASGVAATLRDLGVAAPDGVGRVIGGVELVVGIAGLALAPGAAARVVAAGVAVAFFSFAVVVEAARRRGLQDCGCLGVRPSSPTITHALVNLALGIVSAAAAVVGPVGVADGLGSMSWWSATLVALGVAGFAGAVVGAQSSA